MVDRAGMLLSDKVHVLRALHLFVLLCLFY